ncbi:hypothetical protein EYF80_064209 [Liparis tanakae]|uniref:Uncharacterized protein n=1 Tax=Liparis tanakae TaxID=230148 RepID=A0A4Z2EAR8_9TELE|nr:hypothetical protein EYF80_064209 [Liparis tanakae]
MRQAKRSGTTSRISIRSLGTHPQAKG